MLIFSETWVWDVGEQRAAGSTHFPRAVGMAGRPKQNPLTLRMRR